MLRRVGSNPTLDTNIEPIFVSGILKMATESIRPLWERHLQTVFGAVAIGLLFWIFSEVQTSTVSIALLSQQVVVLTERIDTLTEGQYTSVDAARDFAMRDRELDRLGARIERLEATAAEHEDRLDYIDPPTRD